MTLEELRSLWQTRDERYHERLVAPEVADVVRRGRMQEAEAVLESEAEIAAAIAEAAAWRLPQPESKAKPWWR